MAFLDDDQLAALAIERMVFHLVGPRDEHFVRLEAVEPGPHADFFLGRIKSVLTGAPYGFSDASSTRERLRRIAVDPTLFQEESERLAEDFQRAHVGSAARGAVLLFALRCGPTQLFAILKYDDELVLSYDVSDTAGGRKRVTLTELERTFVQNREALQKSAVAELTDEGGRLVVLDRRNPQRVARYFETFLDAARIHQDEELTEKLVKATRDTIRANRDLVPEQVYNEVTRRTYEAAGAGGAIDVDGHRKFLEAVMGQPLPDDHPILPRFEAALRKERIDGVPLSLNPAKVRPPSTRRLVTRNGIQIRIPIDMEELVDLTADAVVIRDPVVERYDDPSTTG